MIKSGKRKFRPILESISNSLNNTSSEDITNKADDVFTPGLLDFRDALIKIYKDGKDSYMYEYAEKCGVFDSLPEEWHPFDKYSDFWVKKFREEFERMSEFYRKNLQLEDPVKTYYLSEHCKISNYIILQQLGLVHQGSFLFNKLAKDTEDNQPWCLNDTWKEKNGKHYSRANYLRTRDIPIASYNHLLELGVSPLEALGYCFNFDEKIFNARRILYPKEDVDKSLKDSQSMENSDKPKLKKFAKWASDKSGEYVYYIECGYSIFTGNTDIFKGRIFTKSSISNFKNPDNKNKVKFFDNFFDAFRLVDGGFHAPGSNYVTEIIRIAKKDTFLSNQL